MHQAEVTTASVSIRASRELDAWAAARVGTVVADRYVVLDVSQVDVMTVCFVACDLDEFARVLVSAACRRTGSTFEMIDVDIAPLDKDDESDVRSAEADVAPTSAAKPAPVAEVAAGVSRPRKSARKPTGGWLALVRRTSAEAADTPPAPAVATPAAVVVEKTRARHADVDSSGWLGGILGSDSRDDDAKRDRDERPEPGSADTIDDAELLALAAAADALDEPTAVDAAAHAGHAGDTEPLRSLRGALPPPKAKAGGTAARRPLAVARLAPPSSPRPAKRRRDTLPPLPSLLPPAARPPAPVAPTPRPLAASATVRQRLAPHTASPAGPPAAAASLEGEARAQRERPAPSANLVSDCEGGSAVAATDSTDVIAFETLTLRSRLLGLDSRLFGLGARLFGLESRPRAWASRALAVAAPLMRRCRAMLRRRLVELSALLIGVAIATGAWFAIASRAPRNAAKPARVAVPRADPFAKHGVHHSAQPKRPIAATSRTPAALAAHGRDDRRGRPCVAGAGTAHSATRAGVGATPSGAAEASIHSRADRKHSNNGEDHVCPR